MHASAQRVVDEARARGLAIEVREFHEGTHTAADAAQAIGVEVGQIVKCLAFRAGDEVVLALVSGENRLDERALGEAAGVSRRAIRRADAAAVRAATGFAIGGVPPFGHPAPLRTFLDRDLLRYDVVWAGAGTPRHVFSVDPRELARVTGAVVADLSTRSAEPPSPA